MVSPSPPHTAGTTRLSGMIPQVPSAPQHLLRCRGGE